MKLARGIVAYCGLLASVLISHAVGGGNFISIPNIIVFSILIVGGVSISFPTELEGPRLALLALIAQIFGHFLFGGGSMGNSMVFSHLIGGLVGYQLVARFDQIVLHLTSLIESILVPVIIHRFAVVVTRETKLVFVVVLRAKEFFLSTSYCLRGPPLSILN
jgi:hypothetical protein